VIKYVVCIALIVGSCVEAHAALLASFNFDTNLSATSVYPGVTVTGFTPSGVTPRMVQVPGAGVTGGAGQFANVTSTTFVDSATLTLSRPAGLQVDSFTFSLRKVAGSGNGELRITNNVNGQSFIASANSASYSPITVNFSGLMTNSVTFTFARRVIVTGGSSTMQIDNFDVNGVVPEPMTCFAFAGLSLALLARGGSNFRRAKQAV